MPPVVTPKRRFIRFRMQLISCAAALALRELLRTQTPDPRTSLVGSCKARQHALIISCFGRDTKVPCLDSQSPRIGLEPALCDRRGPRVTCGTRWTSQVALSSTLGCDTIELRYTRARDTSVECANPHMETRRPASCRGTPGAGTDTCTFGSRASVFESARPF